MELMVELHNKEQHRNAMLKRVQAYYLKSLEQKIKFSKEDMWDLMRERSGDVSEATVKATLQMLLKAGEIARVGRNAYCVLQDGISVYTYVQSNRAKEAAACLHKCFPYLDFRVMDLVQINEFVNHQRAHNTVFVSVEGELQEFVFDSLKERYPGKVLMNPTPELYHRYWYNDMFVVDKLVSEAPMGHGDRWNTRIEKLLVDIFANPVLQSTVGEAECLEIYEEAFGKYVVDESCMFRYAKRRGAEKRIREFIKEKTKVQLRMG